MDSIAQLFTSSTRTRRGGSCLRDIYKTFLIYRTCMRRAPAKPVLCVHSAKLVSCFTCHIWSSTSHFTLDSLHTSHCALHTALLRLHTSHFTLHTSRSTLHTSHCTLRTPNFTLHSPHFTLHSPHFTLLTSHCFLHTPNFTLHTSHCTLHPPHFTLSHSTLHLIWALLTLSNVICHLSFHESLPSTTTKELACAVRQPGLCMRALCEAVAMLLSKTIVLRMQPRHRATLTQPLQCDLLTLSCKTQ